MKAREKRGLVMLNTKISIYQTFKSFDFSSMKDMRKLVYQIVFELNTLQNSLFFYSLMNICVTIISIFYSTKSR